MKYWITLLGLAILVVLGYGIHEGIYAGHEDTAGVMQRILYACSVWAALFCFLVNFAASIWYLIVKRDPVIAPVVDEFAVAGAETGLLFCTAALAIGLLFEKPMFAWSSRLVTALILSAIYVSYLLARRMAHVEQTPIVAPVIAIVGFVYAPVAYLCFQGKQLIEQNISARQASETWHALWTCGLAFGLLALFWILARQRIGQAEQELHQSEVLKVLDASVQEVG